jgi:LysR family nitrogen assimilation transcriptional regulator
MEFKHLKAFASVAELGSVSKAALRLHTSQPALSRQIMELEKELGLALFNRVGRRLSLTGQGEEFVESCRRLLDFASSLNHHAQQLRQGNSGILKATASPQMIDSVFSSFLPRYAQRYPKVQVRLVEGIGQDVLAKLERGEVHLGTLARDPASLGSDHFGSRPLPPITFSAVYQTPFKLGGPGSINVRDLEPYPLLLLHPQFVLRKTFDAACRIERLRPNVIFECSSPHTLLSLAEAGHGVAVVPSNVRLDRFRLTALRITYQGKPLQEPLSIFWDKRRYLQRYAQDFCDMLHAHIRTVIPAA